MNTITPDKAQQHQQNYFLFLSQDEKERTQITTERISQPFDTS